MLIIYSLTTAQWGNTLRPCAHCENVRMYIYVRTPTEVYVNVYLIDYVYSNYAAVHSFAYILRVFKKLPGMY